MEEAIKELKSLRTFYMTQGNVRAVAVMNLVIRKVQKLVPKPPKPPELPVQQPVRYFGALSNLTSNSDQLLEHRYEESHQVSPEASTPSKCA